MSDGCVSGTVAVTSAERWWSLESELEALADSSMVSRRMLTP